MIQPQGAIIDVVIPALNEERAISAVLDAIPSWVHQIIVVDNGSTDNTAFAARAHGANVVHEPRRGYGAACLAGLAALNNDGPPEIVVFLDADRSDRPQEMQQLVEPILNGAADLVIGSRVLGNAEPGSLTLPQRFGNRLACALIRRIWDIRCTDLGPYRAISFEALKQLRMNDLDFGWTVQMQARAARQGLRIIEVPVTYRRRIGRSKITGTVRGVIGAGTKILGTIARESLARNAHDQSPKHLIVITRLPMPGETKTRLIPKLGEDGAAALQYQMTAHTLNIARQWRCSARNTIEVRYTGGSADAMRTMFGDDLTYTAQGDGSLGDRLRIAYRDALRHRRRPVITIGSDCPEITKRTLDRAFVALRDHDVVIGPAQDGGYYLIGMNRLHDALFVDIDWGTERVFEQTVQKCRTMGLRVAQLETLSDVDEPDDLPIWQRACAFSPMLSVIIPTLNEETRLPAALDSIGTADDVEVIVADGGSTDGTIDIAQQRGASIVRTERGRATQMNAGAERARGEVLLFLHADTRLPFGYRDEIDRVLAQPNTVAGAFRLAFDSVTPSLRLIESGTNVRSKALQLPYGDQALFMLRKKFEQISGYRVMPVMEDFEIVRRIRAHGRIGLAHTAVVTAARRWLTHGAWRMTWRHQRAIVAYFTGRSPERIARLLLRNVTANSTAPSSESSRHEKSVAPQMNADAR